MTSSQKVTLDWNRRSSIGKLHSLPWYNLWCCCSSWLLWFVKQVGIDLPHMYLTCDIIQKAYCRFQNITKYFSLNKVALLGLLTLNYISKNIIQISILAYGWRWIPSLVEGLWCCFVNIINDIRYRRDYGTSILNKTFLVSVYLPGGIYRITL